MGWDRHKLLWDGNGTDKYVPWTTLVLPEIFQTVGAAAPQPRTPMVLGIAPNEAHFLLMLP